MIFEVFALPFDLIGFAIERRFKRTKEILPSYFSRLYNSICMHSLLLIAFAFTIATSVHIGGMLGLLSVSLILSVLLIWKQAELACFYSNITLEPPGQEIRAAFPRNRENTVPLVIAHSNDIGFTGGIVGLPGSEAIIIPQRWLDEFSIQELWAELTRRNAVIASGGRYRGVLLAIIFTVSGILASAVFTELYFSLPVDTTAGLLTLSFCFTLWSFMGLLILPHYSRMGAMEADQLAIQRSVNRELLDKTIEKVNYYLENESHRSAVVESIFHPIPSVDRRLKQLDKPKNSLHGAWQCSRYSVLLSVLGLGLLSRAVHCNAGKPELWGMPPAD